MARARKAQTAVAEPAAPQPETVEDEVGREIVVFDPETHTGEMEQVRGAPMLEFTEEQKEIIRGQIAPDATDMELAFVLSYARRLGLDPIAKQIYAIPRQVSRKMVGADGRVEWVKERRLTIQSSIDGLRLVAARTGDYAGQRGPEWCDKDGRWRDVWLEEHPPAAARVGVLRHGFVEPLYRVAHWREYVPSSDSKMWERMPAGQLAKCAEALALRAAFPAELSGLYAEEEMAQADRRDTDPTGGTQRGSNNTLVTQQQRREYELPEKLPDAIKFFQYVGVWFLMDWISEAVFTRFGDKPESWGKMPNDQKKWVWDGLKKATDWLEEHKAEFDTPIGPGLTIEQAREMFAFAYEGIALDGPVAKIEQQRDDVQAFVFGRQVELGLRNEDGTFTEKGQAEYGVDEQGKIRAVADAESAAVAEDVEPEPVEGEYEEPEE